MQADSCSRTGSTGCCTCTQFASFKIVFVKILWMRKNLHTTINTRIGDEPPGPSMLHTFAAFKGPACSRTTTSRQQADKAMQQKLQCCCCCCCCTCQIVVYPIDNSNSSNSNSNSKNSNSSRMEQELQERQGRRAEFRCREYANTHDLS